MDVKQNFNNNMSQINGLATTQKIKEMFFSGGANVSTARIYNASFDCMPNRNIIVTTENKECVHQNVEKKKKKKGVHEHVPLQRCY